MTYYKTFNNFGNAMAYYKKYHCDAIRKTATKKWIVYKYND